MLYGQDRGELRQMYVDAWRKAQAGTPLSPLEAQIAGVIEDHPEYHRFLSDAAVDRDFPPDSGPGNPFLHMGLHLALRDQVATDRPPGIRALYERLVARDGDLLAAEHRIIECLAETLWEAQQQNTAPDERRYLERLQRLSG